ncbi:MAG: AraC family transcriptional regulator [Bacteroidia bacterium]|nr:AraC family transcriptional regulator [Bacteroidia bacterium]
MSDIFRIKSISEAHDFYGFEKPKHPLVSVLPIDERMTTFDYGERRYTFDFYQISLKEGINGTLSYGRNSYDFREGAMTFIKPNQIVKVENSEDFQGGKGWTLLFHPDLIRRSELSHSIENYSFFEYDTNEALHLSQGEKAELTGLTQQIEKEYQQHIDKHSQEIIIAHIDMLLKYSKRYYDRQFYTRTNLNKDLVSKFEQIMRTYYQTGKALEQGVLSVKYCAQSLNMSSNYFGDLIKLETGRSAKDHIQYYIIEKAKTKLLGSEDTMSEIAYSLGFEYPQGLNKLFKAKTGMSPSQYRSLN